MLVGDSGAVVAHAEYHLVPFALRMQLHRYSFWIETQGVAQQVVQCALQHVRPANQSNTRLYPTVDALVRGDDAGVVFQLFKHCWQIDARCGAWLGIQAREFENLADQGFQAVALLGQARPDHFPLARTGTFGECLGNAQACQW